MNRTRRSLLRAAVVSPVLAGAWVVWELETGRLRVRREPVACCVTGGVPNATCAHPAAPPGTKAERTGAHS
jgi:hypothetical protein